jgi:beta-lactamase class A
MMSRGLSCAVILICFTSAAAAQTTQRSQELNAEVASAVHAAIGQFPADKIQGDDLAATVIDLRDPQHPITGSFRGQAQFYPASVVKLFYLVAAQRWIEDGKLNDSDELRRTMKNMIVVSSNDATGALLDAITNAPNGSVLPPDRMNDWIEKRNAVNRYFASLGFEKINVNQKPYCEGPFMRERIFLGKHYENRNALTTDATARLMSEIALGKSVSAERSKQMMELLQRDMTAKSTGPDDQNTEFTAKALPRGAKLWSKSGWTGTVRHDCAYVELPSGQRLVLTIFTAGHSQQRGLIPAIGSRIFNALGAAGGS